MRAAIFALSAVLLASAAHACELPFSVVQNGPDTILKLVLKQAGGAALTESEAALVEEFNADQRRYWKSKVQSEPVCTDGVDPHNCVSQCKDRPAQIVRAARFKEGALRYSLPAEQRAELQKQEHALEKKWEQWSHVR